LNPAKVQGEGQVVLYLEKLGLKEGLYFIDVAAYLHDWSAAYVYRSKARSLHVRPAPTHDGPFEPQHRWEVRGRQLVKARPDLVKLPTTL
jgi:hypothetical protein